MNRSLLPATVHRQDDGTTLVWMSRRDVPVVSISIECMAVSQDGRRDEPARTDLAAGLLNEGIDGTKPIEWHRRLERDALSISASSTPIYWRAEMDCMSEDLDGARALLSQWLAAPGLPRSEWKRLKKTARASARQQWAQPAAVIDPLASVQAMGYGYPHAHPVFEKSVARAQYDDACAAARAAYRRGRQCIATIGGDVDEPTARRVLEELVAPIPNGAADPDEPAPTSSRQRIWVLDNRQVDQVFFAMTRPGVRANDPQRIALKLADYMIGGGAFSSRLMMAVRSAMGHTYGIHSTLPFEPVPDVFRIQSFTKIDSLRDVLGLIDTELQKILDEGFREDELKDAQDHLHGAVPLGLISPEDILDTVAHGHRAGLSIEDLEQRWASIRQTTLEETNAAAARLIGDRSFHVALIGPAKEVLPQVEGRGEALVRPFKAPPDEW